MSQHNRSPPTMTVMLHSSPVVRIKRPTQTLQDFLRTNARIHDPYIIDDALPSEAANLLMLDLGITEKNYSQHRVLVMSSPYQSCLETSTIVCQILGVQSFYVHFGLGESMLGVIAKGWDWPSTSLYLPPHEMNKVVMAKSKKGERQGKHRVRIEGYLGKPLSNADLGEDARSFTHRVTDALDEIRGSLEKPGDHMIIVAHRDTMEHFVQYGEEIKVFNMQDCGFVTLAMPSKESVWLAGRSRVQIVPPVDIK